jgi:hypothetical protein
LIFIFKRIGNYSAAPSRQGHNVARSGSPTSTNGRRLGITKTIILRIAEAIIGGLFKFWFSRGTTNTSRRYRRKLIVIGERIKLGAVSKPIISIGGVAKFVDFSAFRHVVNRRSGSNTSKFENESPEF